jgi:hypothetical protein
MLFFKEFGLIMERSRFITRATQLLLEEAKVLSTAYSL